MSESNVDYLRQAGTAVIADIFDRMDIEPPVLHNGLAFIGRAQAFAGPCYTITGESSRYNGSDRLKLKAIDAIPSGAVALWAANGALGVCCFGDLLATAMHARGCIAAVVDGGVRDVAFLQGCGMPVLAGYCTPAQGVGRWRVTGYKVPVRIRGALRDNIAVTPDDLIVGDADGVIAVPSQLLESVAEEVRALSQAESQARKDIRNGMPLLAALAKYGQL